MATYTGLGSLKELGSLRSVASTLRPIAIQQSDAWAEKGLFQLGHCCACTAVAHCDKTALTCGLFWSLFLGPALFGLHKLYSPHTFVEQLLLHGRTPAHISEKVFAHERIPAPCY